MLIVAAALCAVVACAQTSKALKMVKLSEALEELEELNLGSMLGKRQAANVKSVFNAQLHLIDQSLSLKNKQMLVALSNMPAGQRGQYITAFYAAQMKTLNHSQQVVDQMLNTIFAHAGGYGAVSDEQILAEAKIIKTNLIHAGSIASEDDAEAQEIAIQQMASRKVAAEQKTNRREYGRGMNANIEAHQAISAGYTESELEQQQHDLDAIQKMAQVAITKKHKKGRKSKHDESSSDSSSEEEQAYVATSGRCPKTGKKGKACKKIVYMEPFMT